jgi:hypothetical protein
MHHFKILLLILLLSFTSIISYAQDANAIEQTVLPLKFNTGNLAPYGMPSTTIMIQGKTIPLLLDTGASNVGIVLSAEAIKNINVQFTGKQDCFESMDGKHCEKKFIIPEMQMGKFTLKNVSGTLMPKLWGGNDKNFKPTQASKNDVIGLRALSRFNLLLDYPNNKVTLIIPHSEPTNYDYKNWATASFHVKGGIITTANINGRPVKLVWDTGAIPSIISNSFSKEAIRCPTQIAKIYTRKDCQMVTSKNFTMNKEAFPNAWFMLADVPKAAPFDGIVGSNFYQNNLVYFDFSNYKLYVQQYTKSNN